MEYTSFLLCLFHSPEKPYEPKKLNKQKSLELLLSTFYKVFTPLEMMCGCSTLYTMRCPAPVWFRAVQGSVVGSGPRIIPVPL
jgi:hypothetical protein